jgi:hypothetical protein
MGVQFDQPHFFFVVGIAAPGFGMAVFGLVAIRNGTESFVLKQ